MSAPKKKLPLIGLTARHQPGEPSFFLQQNYSRAVLKGGGVPLMLPPILSAEEIESLLGTLDALILTGGEDINPLLYGSTPHPKLGAVHTERDRFEIALCRAWLKTGKPLLGICRGLQLLNVAAGGVLIQDIASECPSAMRHTHQGPTTDPVHTVEVKEGSLLGRFLGVQQGDAAPTVIVNSLHHQAVSSIAPGFRVSALAPDGIIEGIEANDGTAVLGVQWHPENLFDAHPEQLRLFASLAGAVGQADCV